MPRRENVTLVACEACRARKTKLSLSASLWYEQVFTHVSAIARHQHVVHAIKDQGHASIRQIQLCLGLPREEQPTNSWKLSTIICEAFTRD